MSFTYFVNIFRKMPVDLLSDGVHPGKVPKFRALNIFFTLFFNIRGLLFYWNAFFLNLIINYLYSPQFNLLTCKEKPLFPSINSSFNCCLSS